MNEYDSFWDNLPTPIKVILVIFLVIYFGGGIIAPFFW